MSGNDNHSAPTDAPTTTPAARPATRAGSIFRVPAPLKRIFDKFPLITYDANDLPQRAPRTRPEHTLHVFTTVEDARSGKPSFNPSCLKWQTYLRFAELPFVVVPSSNHASPTGMLPFLQPVVPQADRTSSFDPVPSNKFQKWLASQRPAKKVEDTSDMRYEAYASLLDNRIRKAWLYQLYLAPQNAALVRRLYVAPCSSQPLVQRAITHQLRLAAEEQLVKSAGMTNISALDLLQDAEEALQALADLLGENEWFFGQQKPGLFDASAFAYMHLLLDRSLGWKYNPLEELLSRHQNLVKHRERIVSMYY